VPHMAVTVQPSLPSPAGVLILGREHAARFRTGGMLHVVEAVAKLCWTCNGVGAGDDVIGEGAVNVGAPVKREPSGGRDVRTVAASAARTSARRSCRSPHRVIAASQRRMRSS